MLTACAWCRTAFPANGEVEEVPVGRRIAFDAHKGRLWIVCRRCERWNLSPIDTRWEAIEALERRFRDTRTRVSTDHVGLARLPDGTELVRIGRPLPVEFAAWRYGDQFGRRRRKRIALGTAGVVAAGALAAGALTLGASAAVFLPLIHLSALGKTLQTMNLLRRYIAPVPDPAGGTVVPVGIPRLVAASDADGGWGLDVPYSHRLDASGRPVEDWWTRSVHHQVEQGALRLTGAPARLLLAQFVPRLNGAGAPRARVRGAVDLIAESGRAEELPRFLAQHRARFAAQQTFGDSGDLMALPSEVRLALEMAAHEEAERAVLAGELRAIEAQWRAAEEEAAISDDLLLPAGVREKLDALRRAVRHEP